MNRTFQIITILVFVFFISCQKSFNRELWIKSENENILYDDNPRLKMVDDLIKNHLKTGMSKSDVIAILGYPRIPQKTEENITKEDSSNVYSKPSFTYLIGPTLGDYLWLKLKFDSSDSLISFKKEQS